MGSEGAFRGMEAAGGLVHYPTAEDIIALNRSLIEESESGLQSPDLIRDRGTIDWALYDAQGLGYEPCDTIIEKATLLAWRIIARHPFKDGNKRTGMGVALTFLITNGVSYIVDDEEIERVAKLVADVTHTGYTYEELKAWFQKIVDADWENLIAGLDDHTDSEDEYYVDAHDWGDDFFELYDRHGDEDD
jgi:death on curing protein